MTKEELIKLREVYPKHIHKIMLKHYPDDFNNVVEFCRQHKLENLDFSSKLYHYIYDLRGYCKCICGNDITTYNVNKNWGPNLFCSRKCMSLDKTFTIQRSLHNPYRQRECFLEKCKNITNNDQILILPLEQLFIEIPNHLQKVNPESFFKYIVNKNPAIYKSILHYYDISLLKNTEILYLAKNKKLVPPICPICGKQSCLFLTFQQGYKNRCSNKDCRLQCSDIIRNATKEVLDTFITAKPDIILSRDQIKNKLLPLLEDISINSMYQSLCKIDRYLVQQIYHNTLYLPETSKFTERVYHIVNDYYEIKKCLTCNNSLLFHSFSIGYNGCGICALNISKSEKELCVFVRSLNIHTVENIRTIIPPNELDIFIPSHNLAIEFNGLYWHSELCNSNKNYHLQKTNKCNESGIQLLHIFSNEWEQKQDIVKSIIQSKLGIYTRRIYARECNIEKIESKIKNRFLEENHLQGRCNSQINYGLYFNNELVSLMCFGKRRITRGSTEWEILRFCTKCNNQVVGGSSRLLNIFEREIQPQKLITYADRRYSNGRMYLNLGFIEKHLSSPCYWYFNRSQPEVLYHRSNFQKHTLQGKLDIFDPSLTEWENMKNNGYNRIWDCGNYVFEKVYKEHK